MIRVSIIGGSGYTGGELIRILLGHPEVEIQQVTSRRYAGKFVSNVKPNLRGFTQLKFSSFDSLQNCDLIFSCLPHGQLADKIDYLKNFADRIIDLSSDFRLDDEALYRDYYGKAHANPRWLKSFVYGLPETRREELEHAQFISGVGCNATAVNLALLPLARAGLISSAVVEVKVGSSEGGASYNLASHHPERSGAMRSFSPTGHRHQAEIRQELGELDLHFSATSVEMVRGILCTSHVFLNQDLEEKAIWQLYRQAYGSEPFVRIVKERTGIYRLPEPKLLAGTNFCEVGFQKDPASNRVVVISALDNLMKGAAGSAVQCMNIALGFQETLGLNFIGLHPA